MKYIMIKVKPNIDSIGVKIPVIFPDIMVHKDVSQSICHSLAMNHGWSDAKVVSAGFINMTGTVTDEKSESLNLGPDKDDQLLINTYQYTHGVIDEDTRGSAEAVQSLLNKGSYYDPS